MSDLRDHLTQIPDLFAQLALFRVAGSRPKDPDARSAGKPGSRPPADLDVIDLEDDREKRDADALRADYKLDRMAGARRQGVLPTLSSWVRLTDAELWDLGEDHEPPGEDVTVATECSFLLTHLAWIEDQQWVGELAEDVATIRADIRRVIGDRDPIRLKCYKAGCGWPVDAMDNGSWFRCTGCGKTWPRLELHKLQQRQQPMKLSDVAEVLQIPLGTLKRWKVEGRISPVARDGVALFSVEHCERARRRAEQDDTQLARHGS